MWVKNKRTIECDKSMVICDVGIAQCDDEIVKCEKKKRVQPNVAKVQLYVMLVLPHVTMKTSNVRKK